MNKAYPNRLRELRLAARMRQEDIAKLIHVARVTYSNYERGTRQADPAALAALARLYHVSVDYITGATDIPFSYSEYTDREQFIVRNLSRVGEPTLNYLMDMLTGSDEKKKKR